MWVALPREREEWRMVIYILHEREKKDTAAAYSSFL